MMQTEEKNRKAELIKQFHTVCRMNGLKPHEVQKVLNLYSVDSSKSLSERQLEDAIKFVDKSDMWRKRVMAAIGAYLRSMHKTESLPLIKGIAERACGYQDFNKIPVARLRDVYYEFVHKNDVADRTNIIKAEHIMGLERNN
jgi:hypothetical protein